MPFSPYCAYVFSYQFPDLGQKNRRLLWYILKSILYAIWRFRNKAAFRKGREKSRGIIRYVSRDIRNRIESDRHRFFARSLWTHPALCDFFVITIITLFFSLIDYVVNISYDPVLGTFQYMLLCLLCQNSCKYF